MRYPGLACVAALMAVAAPAAAQTKEAVRRYAIAADRWTTACAPLACRAASNCSIRLPSRQDGAPPGSRAITARTRLWSVCWPKPVSPSAARAPIPGSCSIPRRGRRPTRREAVVIDEVIVTGTLLRGAVDGPSPVVVVSRDRLDREGRATVAEALAALPQNFGGTANEAAIGNGGDRTGSNANYANGVNLRGLGSDATLVLVNGRRIAGTGSKGDFADVSSIPTAAVERIDILWTAPRPSMAPTRSAGWSTSCCATTTTAPRPGRGTARRLTARSRMFSSPRPSAANGRAATDGGLRASGSRRPAASERPRAGEADLRRFGGSDRRLNYSNPGNIMVFDPVTGAYRSAFAIPAGRTGRPCDRRFPPWTGERTNQRDGSTSCPARSGISSI